MNKDGWGLRRLTRITNHEFEQFGLDFSRCNNFDVVPLTRQKWFWICETLLYKWKEVIRNWEDSYQWRPRKRFLCEPTNLKTQKRTGKAAGQIINAHHLLFYAIPLKLQILPSLRNRTHSKVEAWARWSDRRKICFNCGNKKWQEIHHITSYMRQGHQKPLITKCSGTTFGVLRLHKQQNER